MQTDTIFNFPTPYAPASSSTPSIPFSTLTFAARVVLDSLNPHTNIPYRITTIEATYPRFIHSEIMTHRDRARNAASSRAIPWKKMKHNIETFPVIPIKWGAEQKGMQTGESIATDLIAEAEAIWLDARDAAVASAQRLADLGVHKSICNRLTEPFMWITVVMTATEWANFFRLRCHPDVEIHFQKIAGLIYSAMLNSEPQYREYHLPYIYQGDVPSSCDASEFSELSQRLKKISTARCARVSYLTQNGLRDQSEDLTLFDRLCQGSGFGHWCYDGKTEVMTTQGWKAWPTVKSSDELATVDIASGRITFENPSSLTRSHYAGKMYSVTGQKLDLLVTPNHRMVVQYRKRDGSWSKFDFESAEEVGTNPRRYMKSGQLALKDRVAFQNPFDIDPVRFSKLIAFFAGDGCSDSPNQLCFNLRLPRKIAYLRSIMPYAKMLDCGKWIVQCDGIGRWFKNHCYTKNGNKQLPQSMLFATKPEVAGLLDGFKNSDGSIRRKTWVYDTTSPVLRDQFQAIVHLNGLSASVVTTKRNLPEHDRFRMNVSDATRPRIELRQSGRSMSCSQEWVKFSGEVFCATVSTGALLVRRNFKVCVSGNSPHEHPATAMPNGGRSGPYTGWHQFRKEFERENLAGSI